MAGEWACFERALVVRDIFTGGVRTFLSRDDAQAFRSQIYSQHGAARLPLQHRVPAYTSSHIYPRVPIPP